MDDHIKKVLQMLNHEVPQLLRHQECVEAVTNLKVNLARCQVQDKCIITVKLHRLLRIYNLLFREGHLIVEELFVVKELRCRHVGRIKIFPKLIVEFFEKSFFTDISIWKINAFPRPTFLGAFFIFTKVFILIGSSFELVPNWLINFVFHFPL